VPPHASVQASPLFFTVSVGADHHGYGQNVSMSVPVTPPLSFNRVLALVPSQLRASSMPGEEEALVRHREGLLEQKVPFRRPEPRAHAYRPFGM